MEYFRLHFFKERSRELPIKATIAFFESIEGFTIEMDDDSVRFNYVDPRLNLKARFLITKKSQVADIYRLNPQFLDLNFQLEIPTLSPDYFFEKVLGIVKKIVDRFDYYVYNISFKDVRDFKQDLVFEVFKLFKKRHLDLNPKILDDLVLVDKIKLNSIYRYIDDMLVLQKHYSSEETYVPHYYFFLNQERELKIGFEWKYDTLTVIPAYIDYIVLNRNFETNLIPMNEFMKRGSKYLDQVPGFIKDSFVVNQKNLRKVNRVLRYKKYSKVLEKLTKINYLKLID